MKKILKVLIPLTLILYIVIMIYLLFVLSIRDNKYGLTILEYLQYKSNFIPFQTINNYINIIINNNTSHLYMAKINLIGNLILFLPMGLYLPYFIKKINNLFKYIISISSILILIEIVQLLTRRGSIDIDDFILNIIGALIGYLIFNLTPIKKLIFK